MASLSIAVEAVDKRLDRLRAVVPKSHEDVADLLSQYSKATEVLMHAKRLAQPKSEESHAFKVIQSRLEAITKEQERLVEWHRTQLSENNENNENNITTTNNTKNKINNNNNNLTSNKINNNTKNNNTTNTNNTRVNNNNNSSNSNNTYSSNNNHTPTNNNHNVRDEEATLYTRNDMTTNNYNNKNDPAKSEKISNSNTNPLKGLSPIRAPQSLPSLSQSQTQLPTLSQSQLQALTQSISLSQSQSSLPLYDPQSPVRPALMRMGSRSSIHYQSWAGNLVYRRGAANLPKQNEPIDAPPDLPSPLIVRSTTLTKSGSLPSVPSVSDYKSAPPPPSVPASPLLLSTVITDRAVPPPLPLSEPPAPACVVPTALRLSELQKALRISELVAPADRKVQNEIGDLISTKSAELYHLLWIVRQLDRAISRILNVQLDISELHTILPADTTGLVVSCVPQDVQAPLRYVVSTLRTIPALLADTLLRAGYLAVDQDRAFKSTHYELSQAITFSLFGNCVNPADEKLFLYLLRRITKCQLSIAPTSHLFGKNESFALTLFSTYMNCTYGKPYLICTLKDLVASVLQEDSLNFESDPQKKSYLAADFLPTHPSPPVPTRSRSHSAYSAPSDTPDSQMVLQHFAALFAKRITVRLTPLPYGIRWFAKSIIELWKARLAMPQRSPSNYRRSPTMTTTTASPDQQPPFATSPSHSSPSRSLNPSSVEWQLLCHVVIENIFVPTIIRPEHFGVAAGLPISHRRRSNLILIARMVLEFFTDPKTIPRDLHHIINESMISAYFAALTQVDDPDTHLRSDAQELNSVLISSTDLVLLLELVFQNQSCDSNFMKLVQVVQPAVAVLQEGMQFLVVEVGNDELPKDVQDTTEQPNGTHPQEGSLKDSPDTDPYTSLDNVAMTQVKAHHLAMSSPLVTSPSAPVVSMTSSAPTVPTAKLLSEAALLQAAKQNLRLALSVLDPICGPTYLPLNELLLLQCGRNLSFDAHVMEAHVSETIRCMNALPTRYREDNYKLLLAEMFEDHAAEQRTQQSRKQGLILHLNSTQRHISQLQAQKKFNVELITDVKFKQFREKLYGRMQATFIHQFHDACTTSNGGPPRFCICCPSIHPNKNVVCDKCKVQVESVKGFVARCKDSLVGSLWWRHSSDEEIQVAMNTLERNLYIHIYAWVFAISKEDEKFAANLRKKSASISVNDVFVNRKFHSQAPWPLAQEEIKKINIYKSPQDKVQSIIACWNIIFTYTRPFGEDTGPDDYLPILAYVIIKAQPLHLLSNLQYILLYTSLDPMDEVWVVNFLSAVELVREVTEGELPQHGWTTGVVEHSFLFPSLPIPSERPRKLLHKHKRITKYGTL